MVIFGQLVVPVSLFFRPTGLGPGRTGVTMVVGTIEGDLLLPDRGLVVRGQMMLTLDLMLDPGKAYAGLRADQILCSGHNPSTMKKLSEWPNVRRKTEAETCSSAG